MATLRSRFILILLIHEYVEEKENSGRVEIRKWSLAIFNFNSLKVPSRSPAPGTSPAAVILRSPAPAAASPSPLHASSPAPAVAINSLGHAYSVSSPAPAPSPQFYRAAPSPQQQRSGSLSSTPVASPINYPPGPGPGTNLTHNQSVQLPAGTITIPGLTSKFSSFDVLFLLLHLHLYRLAQRILKYYG